MNEHNSDKKLERLVQRSLVPRGLRPQTDTEIEKLLDTVGGEAYSKEKLERMLRKVKGQEPTFAATPPPVHKTSGSLSEAESELVEMYRAQGKPLPPELEAKLKEMERRAAEDSDDDKPSDGQ